jgi:hypothetical protein
MIKLFLKISLPFFLIASALPGCISLEHVHNFSSSSLESVLKFEVIDYSFKQNCQNNCYNIKINDLIISDSACNCKTDEKADSITLIIYRAIKGYLNGLSNLSENNLTNYKLEPLSESVTKFEMGSVKFEKSQVEAYSTISSILLRAFTDKYRKQKIKEYIKTGNKPVNVLIGFLDFNLSENLSNKLNVEKQFYKDTYFDLTKDATLSVYEKRRAVEEYYDRTGKIDRQQKELLTYSMSLKKIATGHQMLADNIGRLSKDEIKAEITRYASDIEDLISEFNKLKK